MAKKVTNKSGLKLVDKAQPLTPPSMVGFSNAAPVEGDDFDAIAAFQADSVPTTPARASAPSQTPATPVVPEFLRRPTSFTGARMSQTDLDVEEFAAGFNRIQVDDASIEAAAATAVNDLPLLEDPVDEQQADAFEDEKHQRGERGLYDDADRDDEDEEEAEAANVLDEATDNEFGSLDADADADELAEAIDEEDYAEDYAQMRADREADEARLRLRTFMGPEDVAGHYLANNLPNEDVLAVLADMAAGSEPSDLERMEDFAKSFIKAIRATPVHKDLVRLADSMAREQIETAQRIQRVFGKSASTDVVVSQLVSTDAFANSTKKMVADLNILRQAIGELGKSMSMPGLSDYSPDAPLSMTKLTTILLHAGAHLTAMDGFKDRVSKQLEAEKDANAALNRQLEDERVKSAISRSNARDEVESRINYPGLAAPVAIRAPKGLGYLSLRPGKSIQEGSIRLGDLTWQNRLSKALRFSSVESAKKFTESAVWAATRSAPVPRAAETVTIDGQLMNSIGYVRIAIVAVE